MAKERNRKKQDPGKCRATTVVRLATAWGVSRAQVYRGLESGEIRGRRLGRRWIIPESEETRLLPAE
jgi:hypothetical protein